MKIEIDQSGKVEYTSNPTVLAFSNSKSGVLIIKTEEKRIVQRFFRKMGEPRLFAYLCFAAGIFILIKDKLNNRDSIVIDREYPGYEKLIVNKVKEFIKENTNLKEIHVTVDQIGKKSKAHILAYSFSRKKRYDLSVKRILAKDIIRIIKVNLKSGST